MRAARTSVENMGLKCISKEATPSRTSWYTILQKSGVIYRFKCGRVDKYTGESGRTFAERFRENVRASSPIQDHHNITGHELSLDNSCIVGRENKSITRANKEAILIRVNDPSLNRNISKYQLPHIWYEVMVKSPEFKLK